MKLWLNFTMASAAAILLSGCAGAAFNSIRLSQNRYVTSGQELIDLKTAHDEGVINGPEYEQAKKDVLAAIKAGQLDLD